MLISVPRSIPKAEGHWLLGSARDAAQAPHTFVADLATRHNGLASFRVLNRRFVAVSDPELAHQVMVSRGDRYERAYHNRNLGLLAGDGLLATEGDLWLSRLRKAQPMFSHEAVKHLGPAIQIAVDRMLARWDSLRQSGTHVELVAEMQRFTVAAIARVLFSSDVSEAETARLAAIVRHGTLLIRQRNMSSIMWPMWMPTADNRRLRAYRRELDAIIERHIAERGPTAGPECGRVREPARASECSREHQQARNGSEAPDLLGGLMAARDPETGAALSHNELLDETKTLMVAGFETTASTLAWALYLLSRHGNVAAQWHAELDRELGGRTPQQRDLERLPLTAQIVHETMRLYPSVYTMSRQCVRDDELGGYEISKGAIMLVSIYGLHRSSGWGADAESFRPQRFASGAWPKRAFLPFGAGRHLCMGNSLAILEMMLALASIGQRFRLHAEDSAPVEPRAQITLVPSRPIPVRLEARG